MMLRTAHTEKRKSFELFNNLKAYYGFDELTGNLIDLTGNGYDCEIIGSDITRGFQGINGNAYSFPNATGNICRGLGSTTSDDLSIAVGENGQDSPFTVRNWIRLRDWFNFQFILSKRNVIDNTDNREFQILKLASPNVFQISLIDANNNSISKRTQGTPINLLEWAHLVFTYDGSKSNTGLKIYINGVLDNFAEAPTTYNGMVNKNIPLAIGAASFNNIFSPVRGALDEMAIIKGEEWSAQQVIYDYNNGVGRYPQF